MLENPSDKIGMIIVFGGGAASAFRLAAHVGEIIPFHSLSPRLSNNRVHICPIATNTVRFAARQAEKYSHIPPLQTLSRYVRLCFVFGAKRLYLS